MTKRFAVVITLGLVILATPSFVQAQTQSKTLNLEIKNFPSIPTVAKLLALLNGENEALKTEIAETSDDPTLKIATIEVEEVITIPTTQTKKPSPAVPAKTAPENRVYMHEPEIREYVCPKIGQDKCDIFIAILKAENGTHECTRDNRGLNKNGSIDIGLAQINWKPGNPWHSFERLQDCQYNLDVALNMYERRGFQPWYAYTKGTYKKFLN